MGIRNISRTHTLPQLQSISPAQSREIRAKYADTAEKNPLLPNKDYPTTHFENVTLKSKEKAVSRVSLDDNIVQNHGEKKI